ncbi:MAG: hypothetical protein J1G04_04715, partial [Clostridiales bacterium]|nr:hypothetical protein [Clostridiales bacterium]
MENQDKTTFSLDDEEIVEEEVIDRDEEYEDDDYEDEDYGEEEDYDDYEDEDYGEEEDYDDGYDDDYYDDRLNKVLDEIAELKRSMSSQTPAVQMPFAPPPQYVYQPSAPPAGSEVVMYNEISRLRDELAKNQSNLEMQKELSRLKEDMARDQKFAESQYNAEIKRLQDRIEDLLKNGSSPQSELLGPGQSEPARLEGGKSDRNQLDFDKLLSITEAVLRTTKDSDARIRNEIAALKQKVDEFPSNEVLGNALESIKKAASSADAVGADAISRLSNDINALRAAMGDKSAPASVQPSTTVVVNSGSEADVSASELLRQLYEIKNAIGSSSAASVKRTQNLIELIAEYKKVSFDVHSESVPFKDKLSGVIGYSKKLAESNEPDAVELMDATNELIKGLNAQRLNRAVFADLSTFLASNGTPLPVTVRDSAERFFAICERIEAANIDGYSDYLHDLIAERNVLEENRHEKENSELFTQVTDALFAEKRDERTIKELVSRLCNLTVGEITELPLIGEFKAYKPSRSVGDESILNKLAEIKALIEETNAAKPQEEEPKPEPEAEPVTGSFHEQDPGSVEDDFGDDFGVVPESASSSVASQEILDALNELKLAVRAKATVTEGVNDNAAGIDEALQEIRTNYLDVSDKLVGISEMLTAQQNSEAPVDNGADDAQQAIDRQQTLDDLAYIHAKLDEQNEFLAQIPDLRADILNISGTIDFTEQYNALVGEITAQFDKLFEDLSNVIVESEANILNRLGESEGSSEALEQAKADIITETQQAKADIIAEAQSIKDSLFIISDAVTNSAVIDAVEQLRSDLSAFADLTAANVDASTADRQKLLDDIAYLREMADGALSDREQAAFTEDMAAGEQPDLLTVVDEVADRVAQLATVPDELAIVKDNTALILDSVVPLGENVSSAREAALATLDALTPITERVNAILERLDNPAAYEDVSEQGQEEAVPDVLAEDFEQIKENLNTVLDTFP